MKNIFYRLRIGGNRPAKISEPVMRSDDSEERLYLRITEFMGGEQRPFLDGGFDMSKLSSRLSVSQTLVSKAINNRYKHNFRSFLNSFRVEYAVELIHSDPMRKVESVAVDSGFNTLPTFNSAFKKFTGQTPSEYMRHVRHHPRH